MPLKLGQKRLVGVPQENCCHSVIVGLQVSIRESGDVTILDLSGRATIGVDSDLLINNLNKLIATGVLKLLLNLVNLTQLDSSGISAIVRTYVSLRAKGGDLKLLRPCGRVLEVLRTVHLLEVIPSFGDETEALASFQPLRHFAKP